MIDYSTAQIAFTNGVSWSIIGNFWRESGMVDALPLPPITCPLVNLENISSPALLGEAFRKHLGPEGVNDLDEFLERLGYLGASISYPEPMPGEVIPPVMERIEGRQILMEGFEE